MSYQGHLADGSSVQKHSASQIYPYIVFGKGDDRWYFMDAKGVEHGGWVRPRYAYTKALWHKIAVERRRVKLVVPAILQGAFDGTGYIEHTPAEDEAFSNLAIFNEYRGPERRANIPGVRMVERRVPA